MAFFDTDNTYDVGDWLVCGKELVTYNCRILGQSGYIFDTYSQYQVWAKRKKRIYGETDLQGTIAPSGGLPWLIFQEDIDNAVPLNGASLPMPSPQPDDWLMGADGVGWTVVKINPEKLLNNVFEFTTSNRD